jgi:hypothetical protein
MEIEEACARNSIREQMERSIPLYERAAGGAHDQYMTQYGD